MSQVSATPADRDDPTYPSGLRLSGRKVVVVGGGHVAQRRVPGLIAAGAVVHVVSPRVTPAIEGLARSGEVTWLARGFDESDLDGAWYVVAATDDAAVNDAVGRSAEARHTFCVRSDDAGAGSAWTPAVGRHGEVTVAVLGDQREHRDPRRTAALRDRILDALRSGDLETPPDHGVASRYALRSFLAPRYSTNNQRRRRLVVE
jgi:uroporphyrin-III C-methyltransferase / precorrin-2 dehydrogenase / sirohydrochlorin ferrochelatase